MMKKRILSAAAAIIFTAGMTACGNADGSAKAETGPKGKTNGTSETAPAEKKTKAKSEETFGAEADGEAMFAAETEAAADTAAGSADEPSDTGREVADPAEPSPDVTATDDIAPAPEAGQLTAGEWKDNDNWGFLENLVSSGSIAFPFGLDPTVRTAVTVNNEAGEAVVNANVRLKGADGSVLWSAVTNKNGVAYLFGRDAAAIEVESGGASESYPIEGAAPVDEQTPASADASREMTVTFNSSGSLYTNTEIMFIVDTTGSMGDEMLFLQSEFTAITEAVGTENVKYSVNFYRDEGDDYVTKLNPFTTDIADVQRKLNNEYAAGGGDMPEAVAEALDGCLTNGEWSEDSVKLAFLIFDAPPHDNKEEMLKTAVKTASEKGIRLVPVVSSNTDRNTELFARALAIETGGTYVFLTDDSGIGGSHLEPIIGSYSVEKLYDVIIRVINEYRQ